MSRIPCWQSPPSGRRRKGGRKEGRKKERVSGLGERIFLSPFFLRGREVREWFCCCCCCCCSCSPRRSMSPQPFSAWCGYSVSCEWSETCFNLGPILVLSGFSSSFLPQRPLLPGVTDAKGRRRRKSLLRSNGEKREANEERERKGWLVLEGGGGGSAIGKGVRDRGSGSLIFWMRFSSLPPSFSSP